MSYKVYLLWQPYKMEEKLIIASLEKLKEGKYIFSYEKGIKKALELGCFLPIPTENLESPMFFDTLPLFFRQRIIKLNNFTVNNFKINEKFDELHLLTYLNSEKNSDSFTIINAENIDLKDEKLNIKSKINIL